ncbi:MAG: AI-2E family transporter [Clostridiales bacterium]|nr:AI-2E family transporter [Clostridiales bacterium]
MVRLKERTKRVLKWLGLVILIITAIYLFFTKLIKYVAPFLLAFLIMISIERLVSFLQRRLKFPRSIAVAISLLFFVAAVGGILVLTFYKLINELWRLALEIARMDFNPIIEYFESLFEKGQDLFFSLPDSLIATIEQTLEMSIPKLSQIASEIASWLMGIVMGMIDFVKFLPDVLVFIIVMMVSAYFMSRDRRQISEFLSERIPAN